MPLPPELITLLPELLNSTQKIIRAKITADRDVELQKYKTIRKKLRTQVELAKIDATKQICLAILDFNALVFTKKISYLQDSKERLSGIFAAQLNRLQQEKEQFEEKYSLEKEDQDKAFFYQKRIGDLDLQIIELNHLYTGSMSNLDKIIQDLSVPEFKLNIAEARKSIPKLGD